MPRLTLVIGDALRKAAEARAKKAGRTLSEHVRALLAEDAGVVDGTARGRPARAQSATGTRGRA